MWVSIGQLMWNPTRPVKYCSCMLLYFTLSLQTLQVFLETPGDLSSNMRWTGMQPSSASLMEGTAKFSMQLIGRESKVRRPPAADITHADIG